MTIYLDVIFVENMFMNYIILFTTGFIVYGFSSHLRFYKLRLFISSLIGAIYAVLSYTKFSNVCCTFTAKILVSFLMCFVTFGTKCFFKMTLLFYLTSFATGGISLAMIYFFNRNNLYISNHTLLGIYPIRVSILAGFIGFAIIQISFAINKKYLKSKDLLCNLRINILGITFNVTALVDSGNTLQDPYSKATVIVIEKDVVEKNLKLKLDYSSLFVPIYSPIHEKNEKNEKNNYSNIASLSPRLIPFHSVGSGERMLIGIKPTSVEVSLLGNNIFFRLSSNKKLLKSNDVIIGLYDGKISNSHSALIGLNLLSK